MKESIGIIPANDIFIQHETFLNIPTVRWQVTMVFSMVIFVVAFPSKTGIAGRRGLNALSKYIEAAILLITTFLHANVNLFNQNPIW